MFKIRIRVRVRVRARMINNVLDVCFLIALITTRCSLQTTLKKVKYRVDVQVRTNRMNRIDVYLRTNRMDSEATIDRAVHKYIISRRQGRTRTIRNSRMMRTSNKK